MRHAFPAIIASAASLFVPSAGYAASEPIPAINCGPPKRYVPDPRPLSPGPFALAAVHCQAPQRGPSIHHGLASVSPDGRFVALYETYDERGLWIAPLGGDFRWTRVDGEPGSRNPFSNHLGHRWAFAWNSDSRALWTATWERMRPSGWSLGPMRPIQAAQDGTIRDLPTTTHPAGPLDALLWVGGDGLAVAQFGTRGGYYRPEHDDPAPTFGIIDARRGLVLDTLPFDAIEGLQESRRHKNSRGGFVRNTVATIIPDGRVRALLSVPGQWVLWTQGEAPRTLPQPGRGGAMALSPDGSNVLVFHGLSTKGAVIYERPRGGYIPGNPVTGALAALYDLGTGEARWTIQATITRDQYFPLPAISPDGRYALIGLLSTETQGRVGIVSMEDGRIVQELPGIGWQGMGFVDGGRTIWDVAHNTVAFYRHPSGAE